MRNFRNSVPDKVLVVVKNPWKKIHLGLSVKVDEQQHNEHLYIVRE